jgi:hypothetical protein
MRSDLTPTAVDYNILDDIPPEYLKRPEKAEPILYYLPKMVASSGMVTGSGTTPSASSSKSSSGSSSSRFPNLRVLLAAAEDDIRLHRARQQAGRNRDSRLLKTYKIETDSNWLSRQQRLNERDLLLGKLGTERSMIMKELLEGNTAGLTAKEATAIQLARWQRALELYVYDPPTTSNKNNSSAATAMVTTGTAVGGKGEAVGATQQKMPDSLDFLGLLEKLMETSAEVSILMKCYFDSFVCYLSNISFFFGVSITGRRHV